LRAALAATDPFQSREIAKAIRDALSSCGRDRIGGVLAGYVRPR